MNATLRHRVWLFCFVAAAMLTLIACYAPGLHGAFLFDDAANLPALGAYGPIDNGATFLRYITSGRADPTGRPLSMLSFLIDARDWPADPAAFKRTNLVLHGINALLLGVVLAWLGRLRGLAAARADAAGALAAAFWALHPFFVSTVLYVVQREAMLPATFTLIGMLCWLRARTSEGRWAGLSWLIVGVGSCTVLATLSKANGLLLPLLVLISEAVLPAPPDRRFRARLTWAFGPMAAIVIAYLIWSALATIGQGPIPIRGWSVGERLLTEPAILCDYLAQLWLVKATDSSLLHDGIAVASGWFHPWYTLPALLSWAIAAGVAWRLRTRTPALSLAVLFFLAGHLMESTSLALELYFDHRNYLPAMPMFWGLALTITGWRLRTLAALTAMCISILLALLTTSLATVWGNPLAQSILWATEHPESARAQAYATQMEAGAGQLAQARGRIDAARRRFPDEPQIGVNLVNIHCMTGGVSQEDIEYAAQSFRLARREPGPLLANWFETAIDLNEHHACRGLTARALGDVLAAADANPRISRIPGRLQDIQHLRGELALAASDSDEALRWFNLALAEVPNPGIALNQAATLGKAGFPEHGLDHLRYFSSLTLERVHTWRDGMPWIHDKTLELQDYWPRELQRLRNALAAAAPEGNA